MWIIPSGIVRELVQFSWIPLPSSRQAFAAASLKWNWWRWLRPQVHPLSRYGQSCTLWIVIILDKNYFSVSLGSIPYRYCYNMPTTSYSLCHVYLCVHQFLSRRILPSKSVTLSSSGQCCVLLVPTCRYALLLFRWCPTAWHHVSSQLPPSLYFVDVSSPRFFHCRQHLKSVPKHWDYSDPCASHLKLLLITEIFHDKD